VNRLIDAFCRLLETLLVILLALMVVLVFGNVVLRYALNSGITVSEEVSRWLFVWMIFLGAIVALKEQGHLGTDMLTSRLSLAGKKVLAVVAQVMMLYATWLLISGSWAQVVINREVLAPVSGASMAIFYGSGLVFAVCSAILLLLQLWRILSGGATEADLGMSQESEDMAQVKALHLDQSQTFKKR
jgi:TRAP-type transport system small permease protein